MGQPDRSSPAFYEEALKRALRIPTEDQGLRRAFTEYEVKTLLREWRFPVPSGVLIRSGTEDIAASVANLRFPVVAKVSSRTIISKSEVGGVRLGIPDEGALEVAVGELFRIQGAEGVLVEEQCPHGSEVIIGGMIDRQFGPVVMFGLGGVVVELFRDVAFGLAPVDEDGALWLVRQVKARRLLEGFRGRPPVDMNTLTGMIVTVSWIISGGLVEEIDLNPVILYPEGGLVADAKVSVLSAPASPLPLFR